MLVVITASYHNPKVGRVIILLLFSGPGKKVKVFGRPKLMGNERAIGRQKDREEDDKTEGKHQSESKDRGETQGGVGMKKRHRTRLKDTSQSCI